MNNRLGLLRELRYISRHPVVRLAVLGVFLLILGFAGLGAMLWLPAHQQHAGMQLELERVQVEMTRKRQIDGVLFAAKHARTALATTRQRLDTLAEQADQVSSLHELANRHGVTIHSEANRQGEVREGYKPLLQELVVSGDYISIRRFINDIYALPSMTLPWDIVLTAADESGSDVRASMVLATYRRSGWEGSE